MQFIAQSLAGIAKIVISCRGKFRREEKEGVSR